MEPKRGLQNSNDTVLTSTKVILREKKGKAETDMAIPIKAEVLSVPTQPKEPTPKLFYKVEEPRRTKAFCQAFCFTIGVLIILAGVGFGLFFLVTFKWQWKIAAFVSILSYQITQSADQVDQVF